MQSSNVPDGSEARPRAEPQQSSLTSSPRRKLAWAAVRVMLLAAAALFLVRLTRSYWGSLDDYQLAISWPLLVAASVLWLLSYTYLIGLWASSLTWWRQNVSFVGALRLFLISNLARYVPGAVWQFASVAAMSVAEGISPLVAGGAIIVQQSVLLATGLTLTLSVAPQLVPGLGTTVSPLLTMLGALSGLALIVVVLPRSLNLIKGVAERVTTRSIALPSFGSVEFAKYVVQSTMGWIGYAGAFYLFARAVIPNLDADPILVCSAFVGSYVAGIIAVFAPGGIVVREAALVAALGPQIGMGDALALALLSRVWLVSLDIVGTVLFLGFERVNKV